MSNLKAMIADRLAAYRQSQLPVAEREPVYITVQYCPCGHIGSMLEGEMGPIDLNRLDAPTRPSSACPDCNEEYKRQERLLNLWCEPMSSLEDDPTPFLIVKREQAMIEEEIYFLGH